MDEEKERLTASWDVEIPAHGKEGRIGNMRREHYRSNDDNHWEGCKQ
ncbi:MAG: hypothetical protein LBQ36_07070 [Synergistaceae bacterium]|jgi:hypothetical protein|nr:hypothetical protein [Synergistaceae bacterium]